MVDRAAGASLASCLLSVLFATCTSTYAQTGPTGTWRVESTPPWEVVLRADGPRLTGMVSNCFSGPADIEGTLTGTAITFKCRNLPVNNRTMTFTGRIAGDEIAFGWAVEVRAGSRWDPKPPIPTIFGPSAPPRFTVKRVADSDLAKLADQTRCTEFAAVVSLPEKDLKLEGTLLLPEKVHRVRAVIAAITWGLGPDFYYDPQIRKLLETTESGLLLTRFSNFGPSVQQYRNMFNENGADGLVLLLNRFAKETRHREITDAPLVLWGHSASGAFGATFALTYPERMIASVLYHSAGGGGDPPKAWSQVPTLVFKGGKDTTGPNDPEDFWRRGRSADAPSTFALEPEVTHGDLSPKSIDLMIPWITAVIRQRLPLTGSTLRLVAEGSSWLGNNQTGEVAPYSTFVGSKAEASWLPDEASAHAWQAVLGKGRVSQ